MRDRLRRPMPPRRCWRAPRAIYAERFGPPDGRVRGDLRGDLPDRLGAGARTSRSRCARARPRRGSPTRSAPPSGAPARRRAIERRRGTVLREPDDPGRDDRQPPAEAGSRTRRRTIRRCRAARIGVVLANLGTPDATDYWSMRRYLDEFLSDRRVIDYPRWMWQPLLQTVILTKRPFTSGANYRKIWNTEIGREPAPHHHPRAGRGGGGAPGRAARRPGGRRLRHALRQPLDAAR